MGLVALRHVGFQFPNQGLNPHLNCKAILTHWITGEVPLKLLNTFCLTDLPEHCIKKKRKKEPASPKPYILCSHKFLLMVLNV